MIDTERHSIVLKIEQDVWRYLLGSPPPNHILLTGLCHDVVSLVIAENVARAHGCSRDEAIAFVCGMHSVALAVDDMGGRDLIDGSLLGHLFDQVEKFEPCMVELAAAQ